MPAAQTNPAQRLHDLLKRHQELLPSKGRGGPLQLWAEVLGVERTDAIPAYVHAFGLISEVQRAVEVTVDPNLMQLYRHHHEAWARAFFPQSSGMGQAVTEGDVDEAALIALGALASSLRHTLTEGLMPSDEEVSTLREQVAALIDEAREDVSLPMEVRDLMIRRLHDLLWALDHVAIVGPDAIRAACERIAVAFEWAAKADQDGQGNQKNPSFFRRLASVVKKGAEFGAYPGSAYGTYQAIEAIGPYVEVVTRGLGG